MVAVIFITYTNIYCKDDDMIKWKRFPCYQLFVKEIHWLLVNSPHKGQWCGALVFSLICTWTKGWSQQLRHWWLETPSHTLWCHCNEKVISLMSKYQVQHLQEGYQKKRKQLVSLDILRPGQNDHHFAEYIFKCSFVKENFCNLFKILLKFVPWCPSDNDLTVCGCQPDKPMASLVATSRITPQCMLLMRTMLFCCIPLEIESLLLLLLLGHLQARCWLQRHIFEKHL